MSFSSRKNYFAYSMRVVYILVVLTIDHQPLYTTLAKRTIKVHIPFHLHLFRFMLHNYLERMNIGEDFWWCILHFERKYRQCTPVPRSAFRMNMRWNEQEINWLEEKKCSPLQLSVNKTQLRWAHAQSTTTTALALTQPMCCPITN